MVARQKDFLDHGVQHIKPMMLKDIAEDIGMHLSTVSRVVNRKYAHTPQGVIELRRFFTEGMMNEDGEEISTRIIKLKIKKLIEEEDSHAPITDDQVVKILIKDGIKLSRRTVAKYRDQMSIPGSRERRAVVSTGSTRIRPPDLTANQPDRFGVPAIITISTGVRREPRL